MALRRQPTYPSLSWPASPTASDLADPAWLSAYGAARVVQPVRNVTVHDMLKPNRAAHFAAGVPGQMHEQTARGLQATSQLARRSTADGLSCRQALIASTARPRATDIIGASKVSEYFGPSKVSEVFGPSRVSEVFPVAQPKRRSGLDLFFASRRFFESITKPNPVFEAMDRQQTMLDRLVPEPEPIPGLAGSLIRPLPPIGPLPPSDEVVAEMQAECQDWLSACPKVVSRLEGAHDAISRGGAESLAQGLLSCRRALVALADHVYPPRPDVVIFDRKGQPREIGAPQWKNRLILFFEGQVPTRIGRQLDVAEVELLVVRLNALTRTLGVGVHDDLSLSEARRIYVMTWSLVAEIVRHADG